MYSLRRNNTRIAMPSTIFYILPDKYKEPPDRAVRGPLLFFGSPAIQSQKQHRVFCVFAFSERIFHTLKHFPFIVCVFAFPEADLPLLYTFTCKFSWVHNCMKRFRFERNEYICRVNNCVKRFGFGRNEYISA